MKKILFALFALSAVAAAAPADAADMPLKAPPPVYSWSGFYLGGNVGYSWGTGRWTYSDPGFGSGLAPVTSGSDRLDGIIGGGQIGYNWQVNQTWVWGVEADFQGTGEKGTRGFSDPYFCDVCVPTVAYVDGDVSSDIRWFGTVRGRAGVLVNPTLLFYGTGGLAYGGIRASGSFFDTFPGCSPAICNWSFSQTTIKLGWTAGAGVEGTISNMANWTWKVEYLYIDFGNVSGNSSAIDPGYYSWSTHLTDNIVRVGLNYHFH